jgi:hypothetical protein
VLKREVRPPGAIRVGRGYQRGVWGVGAGLGCGETAPSSKALLVCFLKQAGGQRTARALKTGTGLSTALAAPRGYANTPPTRGRKGLGREGRPPV